MLACLDAGHRALLGYETVFNNEQRLPFVAYEAGAGPSNPDISPQYVYEWVYVDEWDLVQLTRGDGEVFYTAGHPVLGYAMPFRNNQQVNCRFDAGWRAHRLVTSW
jgi:hypothetical protein